MPGKLDSYSKTPSGYPPPNCSGTSEHSDTYSTILPPPPVLHQPPPINRSRRTVSSDGALGSNSYSMDHRSSSLGHSNRGHRRSTSQQSRSQLTRSTTSKNSTSTDTSTDEKQKEIDNPILKRFEIKRRLGKGAYGIVWEAFDRELEIKVALKKIFDAFRNSTDSQRTYREIMFLREFGHHPNIISLVAVHKASNEQDIYLVFPYMDYDLHKLVKVKPEALTDSATRSIIYQILIALKYLHSAEVIHRDLKPANILMDEDLRVKVADFGLARSLTNNPEDSIALEMINPVMTDYVATRWYRPPEILLSCKTYTKGVDMWSIGCILGEILLKKPLFAGSSTIDQIQTILKSIERPRDEDIKELCRGSGNKLMNPSVIKAGLAEQGDSIEDIFQDCDLETVDFLERLLVFNPNKRLNVDQALTHPYLSSVRDPEIEGICEHLVRPPLSDDIRLKVQDYRKTIYAMIEKDESRMRQIKKLKPPNLDDELLPFIHREEIKYHEEGDDLLEIEDDFCDEYEQEFREYAAKSQPQRFTEDYQEFLIPEHPPINTNDILDESSGSSTPIKDFTSICAPTDIANNDDNNNINNNDNYNRLLMTNDKSSSSSRTDWLNYGNPTPVISKSVCDRSTPVAKNFKNVSILTIPSENSHPKPYTVPLIMPSQMMHTRTSTGTEIDEDGGDGIIEKFQSLCQKYDVTDEDFGLLANYKKEKKQGLNNFNKAKKAQSCGDYEFLARGDFSSKHSESTTSCSNNQRRTSPNSWKGIGSSSNNNPSITTKNMTQGTQFSQYQPKLPSLMEGDGDNNKNAVNDFASYNGDVRMIQDTLSHAKDSAATTNGTLGFVNPYKPKGLKTSLGSKNTADLFSEDFEIRNSRSLPSQLDTRLDFLKSRPGSGISGISGYTNPTNNANNNEAPKSYQSYPYSNKNGSHGNISMSMKRQEGSKSIHRRQDNPPASSLQTHQSTRLQELFPNKEAMQDRIEEMERRGKAKGGISQESLNSTEGLILINGKNNTYNKNQRQKKHTELQSKTKKFTFNRPGRKDEVPQPPVRPFGGRHYDKKFHGPSFRRTLHQSFSLSDPECTNSFANASVSGTSTSWNPLSTNASQSANSNLRPTTSTTDAQIIRKPISHSAYFPNAGVTHPLSNHKYNNARDKLSTSVKTNHGFSSVHPIPSYNDSNSRSNQGHGPGQISHNQASLRSQDYNGYSQKTPLQSQYATTVHYDDHFESPSPAASGADTIRASDLFELRNNVARDRRLGNMSNIHKY